MSILNYLIPVNWDGEEIGYELALTHSLKLINSTFDSYDGEFDVEDVEEAIERLNEEEIEILSVSANKIKVNKESLPDVVELPNNMVVDIKDNYMEVYPEDINPKGDISYIGYTGSYPALCCGVLWVKVDDNLIGLNNMAHLGGSIIEENLPNTLKARAKEIQALANEHIPSQCCGGCL